MYQIFFTEGEYEPWWFFEDWQSLIIKKIDYPDLNDAKIAYREFTQELANQYPYQKEKEPYLAAYWCEEEMVYCESCDDDIQLFHGVMLLRDEKVLE